ncbi:hypothetical protein B0H13DRAFT_1895579 [Mycena leptocephala]|nr:hypothetical protein B0H13DRAFT_1895579 [Mycena leptocephala]
MKLSIATLLFTSTIVFPRAALAALTPAQVVANIEVVTSVSKSCNDVLGDLIPNLGSAKTVGENIVTNLVKIITNLGADVTAMQATPPFIDAVAGPIVDALKEFVRVHQQLLATVIGKHGIFAQFGVTAPIAAILQSLEAAIDAFAFAMINLIPTKQGDVTADKNSLDASVVKTVTLYKQLCIPSPLYPTLPAICIGLHL